MATKRLTAWRTFSLLLLFYATGAMAANESLHFRLAEPTDEVIAVISGVIVVPCGPRVVPPLVTNIIGTTINITSYGLDGTGGCTNVIPPAYYEVTTSLGHLSAPLYAVKWDYIIGQQTLLLAPSSLVTPVIPALSHIALIILGLSLAISGPIFGSPRAICTRGLDSTSKCNADWARWYSAAGISKPNLSTTTAIILLMAKAYWISAYRSIHDPEALAAYAKLAGPALQKAGGRFLARGMPAQVYESGLSQRTVLVEFDSVAQAIAAHDSPAYQEALRVLGKAVDRELRIIEGVE